MVVRRDWISVLSDPTTLCVEYTLESKEAVMQSYGLRHTIQHEIATEHLIAHGCRLITAVSLHCKLSLTRLLQSIAVILYLHEYVEGFVYNESE